MVGYNLGNNWNMLNIHQIHNKIDLTYEKQNKNWGGQPVNMKEFPLPTLTHVFDNPKILFFIFI